MSTESSLRDSLAVKSTSIKDLGDVIRNLKSVSLLNALKLEKTELENELEALLSVESKEAFRKAVENVCERNLFYLPTGVAGYYAYGPPGVEIESKVLDLWRKEKFGIPLVACENFAEPKEVEKLVIRPNKKVLGPDFKHDHTFVVEALKAMTEKEAMKMKAALESEGKIEFEVCKLQKR